MELRYPCCIKLYQMFFTRQKSDSLLKRSFSIRTFQHSFHLVVRVILEGQVNKDIGRCSIRQWKLSTDKGIFNCNSSIVCEENVIPDTDITTTDSGNPVPADSSMKSGIVRSRNSPILVCTVSRLFLDGPRMSVFDNLYSYGILSLYNLLRHIELTSHECTVYFSDLLSIQEYIRFPVDTIKIQKNIICRIGYYEFIAIPEIREKEGF